MHSLLFGSGLVGRLRHEIPSAAGALALAELFYKFHSFTLECLAFLATWLVIGSVLAAVLPTRGAVRSERDQMVRPGGAKAGSGGSFR